MIEMYLLYWFYCARAWLARHGWLIATYWLTFVAGYLLARH